jgi:hypothetical protein
MKTENNPVSIDPKNKPDQTQKKDGTSQPKKPGNDPDQTPEREVKDVPKAKPEVDHKPDQKKIGF